jgi:hypothetical protein
VSPEQHTWRETHNENRELRASLADNSNNSPFACLPKLRAWHHRQRSGRWFG